MNKLKLLTVLGSFSAGVDPGPYEEEIARLEAELAEKEQRLIELQNELNTAEGEIAEQAATIAALQQDISDLNNELESLRAQIELLNTTISDLNGTIAAQTEELAQKDEQIVALNEELSHARTEIEALLIRADTLEQQVVALQEHIRNLSAEITAKDLEIEEKQATIDSQAQIITEKDATITEQAARIEELEREGGKVPFGSMVIGGTDGNYTQVSDLNGMLYLDFRITGDVPPELRFTNLMSLINDNMSIERDGARAAIFSYNQAIHKVGTAENPAFPNINFANCGFEDSSLREAHIGAEGCTQWRWTFENCSNLHTADVCLTNAVNCEKTFRNCGSLSNLTLRPINGYYIGNANYRCNAPYMFADCTSLTTFGSAGVDYRVNISDAQHMFDNCTNLERVDISFEMSGTFNADYMFYNCAQLREVNIQSIYFPVSSATHAFEGCKLSGASAIHIASKASTGSKSRGFSLDVWDMSTIENIDGTYYITEDFYNQCYKVLDTDKNWTVYMRWFDETTAEEITVITTPYVPETGYYPAAWKVDEESEGAKALYRMFYTNDKAGTSAPAPAMFNILGTRNGYNSAASMILVKGEKLLEYVSTIPGSSGRKSIDPDKAYLYAFWDTTNDRVLGNYEIPEDRVSSFITRSDSSLTDISCVFEVTRVFAGIPQAHPEWNMPMESGDLPSNDGVYIEAKVYSKCSSVANRVINFYGNKNNWTEGSTMMYYQLQNINVFSDPSKYKDGEFGTDSTSGSWGYTASTGFVTSGRATGAYWQIIHEQDKGGGDYPESWTIDESTTAGQMVKNIYTKNSDPAAASGVAMTWYVDMIPEAGGYDYSNPTEYAIVDGSYLIDSMGWPTIYGDGLDGYTVDRSAQYLIAAAGYSGKTTASTSLNDMVYLDTPIMYNYTVWKINSIRAESDGGIEYDLDQVCRSSNAMGGAGTVSQLISHSDGTTAVQGVVDLSAMAPDPNRSLHYVNYGGDYPAQPTPGPEPTPSGPEPTNNTPSSLSAHNTVTYPQDPMELAEDAETMVNTSSTIFLDYTDMMLYDSDGNSSPIVLSNGENLRVFTLEWYGSLSPSSDGMPNHYDTTSIEMADGYKLWDYVRYVFGNTVDLPEMEPMRDSMTGYLEADGMSFMANITWNIMDDGGNQKGVNIMFSGNSLVISYFDWTTGSTGYVQANSPQMIACGYDA